jgi:hypothetical protein
MASDEIRLTLGYIILHFDIVIKDHGQRPKNVTFNNFLLPDMKAEIMLRRREPNAREQMPYK